MKKILRAILIANSILLIISGTAFSENGEENKSILGKTEEIIKKTITLPIDTVKGILNYTLDPLVVTPLGTEKHAFNVSKNVSVITKEEIANSAAQTVPELLSYEAGISTSQLLGNPKGASIDIRGFGEASNTNVLVLLDGRRINQIDLSGVDWAQIDINIIERIEIVKGASTVLYGDNATAGVINIITKRGSTSEPVTKIGVEIGSHVFHKEYGTFEGYHDIMDYFFSYSQERGNGYRENNRFESSNIFGRLTLHPVRNIEFGTSFGYHKDKYGMPGSLRQNDIDSGVGRRGTVNPDDMAETEDIFVTGEPKAVFNLLNNTITASVHGTYRHRESEALNFSFTPAFNFVYIGETDHKIDSGNIRPKIEVDSVFCDGNVDNTLILGTDHFIAVDSIRSGNILLDHSDISKRTTAIYVYDNIEILDRFLLNGGYRYEWLNYKFEQKGILTNNASIQLNEWAFEIGGGYKYNPASQVYVNYSRSYRLPTTEEYYQTLTEFWGMAFGGLNDQIKQQVGHNFEVGIKDNSLKWLSVNADFFIIDTKREIYFNPVTFTNTNYAPRTKRHGFDIECRASLMDNKIMPFINYTWQSAKFDGSIYNNNNIPFVPNNIFSAGLTASPIKNLKWNVVFNYTGSRYFISDQANRVQQLNSYCTVDSKFSYKWKKIELYAGGTNLFNRKYHDSGITNAGGTAVTFYPAPARRLLLGCRMEF